MPDSKITALASTGTGTDPANDPLVIVDVSDTSMAATGTTKKVTLNNLLACSPTATLASATITGDLTVRTNQLVVNSSGSFVGKSAGAVGTDGVQLLASGFSGFSASGNTALFVNRNTSDGTVLQLGRSGASAADFGAIAGGGFTVGLSGSEWMRINSIGLGVGVVPSYKLDVQGADNSIIAQFGGVGGRKVNFTTSANGGFANGFFNFVSTSSVGAFSFQNTSGTLLTIDSIGNVGIGITPSAWSASYKGLQLKESYAGLFADTSNGVSELVSNAYNDGAWKFANAGNGAARYRMDALNRTHAWFYAATSANPITWTQAMTLDASGRLLVGPTSANASGGILQLSSGITFPATQVASSDANTLDDYEEGTFVPTMAGTTGAGTGTYSIQTGFYTKIGNTVFFRLRLDWSAHTGTGSIIIDQLPFVSSSTANSFSSISIGYLNNIALTASSIATALIGANQAFVTLQQYASGGGASSSVSIDTSGGIMLSGFYTV